MKEEEIPEEFDIENLDIFDGENAEKNISEDEETTSSRHDEKEEDVEEYEEEPESRLSSMVEKFKNRNKNHHTSNDDIEPGKGEALRLQREYESGVLDKKNITSEQLDNLIALYEEQIHELTVRISRKSRS